MTINSLSICNITPYTFTESIITGILDSCCYNPTVSFVKNLFFRSIPENPIVSAGSTDQVITAAGPNRYLQSVIVKAN